MSLEPRHRQVPIFIHPERRRPAGLHHHVEHDGLEPGLSDLDLVGTSLEIQVLEHAVEVVHDPDVVAVGEHLRDSDAPVMRRPP